MYLGFLVDQSLLADDPHFENGCSSCHKGHADLDTRAGAHQDLVVRPSDDLTICAECHEEITEVYKTSLHYTTAGLRSGIHRRLSSREQHLFDAKVFQGSCRSCHAACGDCHVKGPVVGGISIGLIERHRFVKKDESKTCAFCHGGRVYPEFTGSYGVIADIHFEKGMKCSDCHKEEQLHGDGHAYTDRRSVGVKPSCADCHAPAADESDKAKTAHSQHDGKLSCSACHSLSTYRNCTNCHLGKGSDSKAGFFLGLSPQDHKTVTTLRLVPTVRDTFSQAGIRMERYDEAPNYWDATPHATRKLTERTNNCNMCHLIRMGFLDKSKLIKDGATANQDLIRLPGPIKQSP